MNNDTCWICGTSGLKLERPSGICLPINAQSFAITDSQYGVTGTLYRCPHCEFLECADLCEVLGFYEALEDHAYEEGRVQRALQAQRLLEIVMKHVRKGRLVDIGAGSGILVEQASALGFDAEGVEPSRWLRQRATDLGLCVHQGIYPHPAIKPNFDVVTIVDVIEHVSNPVELLQHVSTQISPRGIGMLVTPDVGSIVARWMGFKWWHFRIAHIGYFNQTNLLLALDKAGLVPIESGRPSWYFSADYIVERLNYYLPWRLRFPILAFMRRITIPLNLRDSLYIVFKKKHRP